MAEEFKNTLNDSGGAMMSKSQAETSMKALHGEAARLDPTALIELFEIDLSDILTPDRLEKREKFNQLNLLVGGSLTTNPQESALSIFRFHNSIKLFKRDIWFQGNRYFPFPCKTEGFEVNSNGTAATPTISFGSRPEALSRFAILKELMRDLNDLTGARVNRIRTFTKFLDNRNWFETDANGNLTTNPGTRLYEDIPKDIAPDENSFFPPDVYYIDKKSYEDKTAMQFQLASYVNFEEIKLPRRIFNQNRCNWKYRGQGCLYETTLRAKEQGTDKNFEQFDGAILPGRAPAVATENNEKISDIISSYSPNSSNTPIVWAQGVAYQTNQVVYITHHKINYYFVAKSNVPENTPPPNETYWVADQCSKTLAGCKMRWSNPDVLLPDSPFNGALPFGGFPAITKR